MERREQQLPFLEAAEEAADRLAVVVATGGSGDIAEESAEKFAEGKTTAVNATLEACHVATSALLEHVGQARSAPPNREQCLAERSRAKEMNRSLAPQGSNATAMEYATELLSTVVALGATGYAELTATAVASTIATYKSFCTGNAINDMDSASDSDIQF